MLKRFSDYKYSLAKTIEPVITRLHAKIKFAAEKKPYTSLAIMFAVLLINTIVVFRLLEQGMTKNFDISMQPKTPKTKDTLQLNLKKHFINTLALGKFFEIQHFKDSLEYYRNKKPLTHEDSLALVKLLKSYQLIDPDFINQLQSASSKSK